MSIIFSKCQTNVGVALPSKMSDMLPDDNKYKWNLYEIPPWPFDDQAPESGDDDSSSRFVIRHLKQGRTGAVKTWPTAAVLLDYLIRRGGLMSAATSKVEGGKTLDLTSSVDTQAPSQEATTLSLQNQERYNIVELGGGSGYLSVALALSMNRQACLEKKCGGRHDVLFQPRVRLLCTDNDGPTLKNMRHNVIRQTRENHVTKAVAVERLGWGNDVGGDKFSKALGRQFSDLMSEPTQNSNDGTGGEDPIGLLTHVIGSDVHWGEATLGPLSSVISGFKLRNPKLRVILLLTERGGPCAVADLQSQIEHKVKCGLEALGAAHRSSSLHDFVVNIRSVVHDDSANSAPMKMVEC